MQHNKDLIELFKLAKTNQDYNDLIELVGQRTDLLRELDEAGERGESENYEYYLECYSKNSYGLKLLIEDVQFNNFFVEVDTYDHIPPVYFKPEIFTSGFIEAHPYMYENYYLHNIFSDDKILKNWINNFKENKEYKRSDMIDVHQNVISVIEQELDDLSQQDSMFKMPLYKEKRNLILELFDEIKSIEFKKCVRLNYYFYDEVYDQSIQNIWGMIQAMDNELYQKEEKRPSKHAKLNGSEQSL